MNSINDIKVSICCITYNQVEYIQQCLSGFVQQKTSFQFEIIINDDCSTDGTKEIIEEYSREYPDLIITIFHKQNQYSLGHTDNEQNCFKIARGIYIALCEGDDYWIDTHKLQKQVDFLDSHPDYGMCFHRAALLDYIGEPREMDFFHTENRDYSSTELFSKWIVPTASMLFRRECLNYNISNRHKLCSSDISIVLQCSHTGKIRGMSDYMSVYRIQTGGVTYDKVHHHRALMKYPEHMECIRDNFPKLDKKLIDSYVANFYFLRSRIQPTFKLRLQDQKMSIKNCKGFLKLIVKDYLNRLNPFRNGKD